MMDPRDYVASETLKDGTFVIIRAIRLDDADAIVKAFNDLDRESVYRRFFGPKKELTDDELAQLTDVDFKGVVALLVTKRTGESEVLMGGGRFAADNPGSAKAELAFVTGGNYRGLGIASLILRHLVRIAQEFWHRRFRGGCPRRKPADACRLSEKRTADAAWARRKCSTCDASATTRTHSERHKGFEHVCLWHLADILPTLRMSAFRGEADIPDPRSSVR